MGQPQNFQPQGRDTSNGPNIHTYIPREDGSISINGVTFLPQSGVATAATIPVTSTGIPIATASHPVPAQPWVIPPVGSAIPAYVPPPVHLLPPQIYPLACHYFPLQTRLPSSNEYAAVPFPYPYYRPASASE